LNEQQSFILESTLSGKYLLKLFNRLKREDYEITIIFVFLESVSESINRIKVRVKKGGHHIPDEDVERRFFRSIHNFWNIYRFQCDEWQLFYNGKNTFEQIAFGYNLEITVIDSNNLEEFKRIANE